MTICHAITRGSLGIYQESFGKTETSKIMRVGFIGWRGMVGSVLMERMIQENDFTGLEPIFFTTSNPGALGPDHLGFCTPNLVDAHDLKTLREMEVVVSCQGGDYTKAVYPKLRESGWSGYWIDAASSLRMEKDSVVILDPVNRHLIDRSLTQDIRTFVGGNCTVSLMMMALAGLFQQDEIEWISAMTYQAASGAGAKNLLELVAQFGQLADSARNLLSDGANALAVEKAVTLAMRDPHLRCTEFGAPLAGSLIPWIDSAMDHGQTREEWKGMAETNKILGASEKVVVDGLCIRIGTLRCHSQGLTVKLRRDIPLDEIADILDRAHQWVEVIPNEIEASKQHLTPTAVTGTLQVPVGRLRKMKMGGDFLTLFTVGDQLLWGAAEPLRRMLRILREQKG